MKNKRAFTLVELLAVIIILGILMLIAIPSVTKYIDESRKSSYINTAKAYIRGTSELINSGEIDGFDTDTTYYLPASCVETGTEPKSPYGKFTPAYVVYTYDEESFDYYWTSTDEKNMGIIKITPDTELDVSNIKPDSKPEDINTDRTIDGRSNIVVYQSDCKTKVQKPATIFSQNYKVCKYDGELEQGAEFIDGQYKYRYMQEASGTSSWTNISQDGWGVMLADKNSTEPVTTELCSEINGKDIVSMKYMFYYSRAPKIDTSSFKTSEVTNMYGMFYGASSISLLSVESFNTSKVTNMSYMFAYASTLEHIKSRNEFNTSNVTNMSSMFSGASRLTNVAFMANSDTSNVTTMSSMFSGCNRMQDLGGVKNWNTSSVTTLDNFLYSTSNLKNLDALSKWDVSNVTSIRYPFSYSGATNIEGLRNWKLDKLTNLNYMFYNMTEVEDLSAMLNWDMSKITSLNYTFSGLRKLTNLNSIRNLDISHVTSLYGTFSYSSGIHDITALTNWDMRNVENMDYMFSSATGVEDYSSIKQWNIPKVSSMKYMFQSNSQLRNIRQFDNWNLQNVTSIRGMFYSCSNLTDLTGLPTWIKPNLTDMSYLFSQCSSLTNLEGLRYLNLDNVTNISFMFYKCHSLESISPLANWDVSGVTNVAGLFGCEYIYNMYSIRNWDISNVYHPSTSRVYSVNGEYAGFYLMFKTTRYYNLYSFNKRSGCWAGDGTFVPNGSGSVCNTNDNYRCDNYGGCLDGDMEVIVYDEEKKKRIVKKIKDIKYTDLILVWDFDNGKYEWAKPLWIMNPYKYHESVILTFDDGTILKVVGDHKIYNDDSKMFTSARFEEETPIGTHTINSEGKLITLINREIIRGDVYAYNIITDKHINLFANGIITSRGSNNLYPIENMKFVKEERESFTRNDLIDIPDEYYYGLRLNERSFDYCDSKEETKEDVERLVNKLLKDRL